MYRVGAILVAALVFFAPGVGAADKAFTLKASPEIIDNGLVKFLRPRFSLKTGTKITVEPLPLPVEALSGADAYLLPSAALPSTDGATRRAAVFGEIGGRSYSMVVMPGAGQAHAERFMDWLASKVGAATLAAFKIDGEVAYGPAEAEAAKEVVVEPTGDTKKGEQIALRQCGRCHVVSDKNKFAGIGSTPSFGAMKTLPRWRQRFEAFWTLNPHPSFTQIEGVTPPFDPERPPHIAPLMLTLDDMEALMAFVLSIKPKDLGPPLTLQ